MKQTQQEIYVQRAQTSADPEDPDFGLPDPKRDPDRHQNCIAWSLSHALPSKKFRKNPFTSLRVIRRTDRQKDRTKNITSFFGGGNNQLMPVADILGQFTKFISDAEGSLPFNLFKSAL